MNKLTIYSIIILAFLATFSGFAQEPVRVKGKVISPYHKEPISGAIISARGADGTIKTDSLGQFEIEVTSEKGEIEIWAPGYYSSVRAVSSKEMTVLLVPSDKYNYNENLSYPFRNDNLSNKATSTQNIAKDNFSKGGQFVDEVLHSAVPGLNVVKGSGMPGEGSYMSLRGVSSIIGKNAPLILIDGVPYLPDMEESPIISGYTSNIFNTLNAYDIKNITVLKGADATMYGSMGSNGVIMIETDDATDLDTRITFISQNGVTDFSNFYPTLNTSDYKKYISNVALTAYEDMGDILVDFPFLKEDPDYYYNFLYNNNTDWQEEIYRPALQTHNVLKIKGGDAIAKYDLSFGYLNQQGVIENTGFTRYNMRLNSNINISQKLELFASMSLAYTSNELQEQGMVVETNPLLAAMAKSPLYSPYAKDEYNNILPDYASIRDEDGNIKVNDAVTNPVALVNSTEINTKGSDVMISGGLNYDLTSDLKLTGMVGVYSNHNTSKLFVPGVTITSIMPLEDGLANNTVREGVREAFNMYYNFHANYQKKINDTHFINATAGWQTVTTRMELDAGMGRNTSSDFYKTLGNVSSIGWNFTGYIKQWNWMNGYAQANYNYNHLLGLGVNLSVDHSSSIGDNASPLAVFPGVNASLYLHNLVSNSTLLNKLVLRGEVFQTGNSTFNSNISDYYYQNQVFRQLSGIVRANIPNTDLKWEVTTTSNIGVDLGLFRNKVDLTLDVYNKVSTDVIMQTSISPVYGEETMYDNTAEIKNTGFELGAQAYLLNTRKVKLLVGGTIAKNKNEVLSLGGEDEYIMEFNDGSAVISRVGSPLYSFYGYETNGVYATSAQASSDGYTDYAGNSFSAGDVRFVNNDASNTVIDDDDRVMLGSADPDFFGSLYGSVQVGRFSFLAKFNYSYGNEIYNAVRREFESMDNYGNQLVSTKTRWQTEGQVTDMPRAVYGDPMNNSRFSDRFVEDGSYIKLREATINYDIKAGALGILQGGSIYLTGENLWVLTDYLGSHPELSYSYMPYEQGIDWGKVPLAPTVKIGFKLQF